MSRTRNKSPVELPREGLVPLEAILCTEELTRRPSRPPDYETENRALAALARALADSPGSILQELADIILEAFQADSAGLSLLNEDGTRFYWPAIAGAWKPHVGGGTPRDFGPCGDVLDRNAPLLFKHFERRYAYLLPATPPAEEALLIPFYVDGTAVGTIWAMAHDDRRRFDAEDLRQLETLGRFAAAAYQASGLQELQDSRRAALNLMEDAVQARQLTESLNRELRGEIAERKRAEEATAQSEQRQRALVSVLADVPWTTDPTGAFISPQPAWTAYTGQTWEELLGFGWAEALHPADRASVTQIWQRACESASLYESRGRLWHAPTGEYRHFLARATPLLNDDGSVREWVGACTDVHEQTMADGDRARLAAIVTYSEDAIISKDLDGVIATWNRGAEHLFGYTAAEAVGKPVTMLIPDDRLDEEPEILERIKRGELVDHFDTVRRRKDGTLLEISLTISPIREASGRIIGASKVARDITERSRLERKTREQAETLADLHRRKDEFLAMLSHELRNPLAAVANAVQLLRLQRSQDPLQRQASGVIERQVGNLTRLVDDLLEVSRITTGRIHLHRERLVLNGVVERAVETVRALIGQRRHSLKVALPPQLIWLDADAARLEQVVVNLLTNAAKYTEEAGFISLSLQQEGDEAVLRVRDSGVGIDPESLPRIFDLFTQAERTLDRSQGGLGIGLSLVQRLVEMHGGRVEAYSALGHGSEFVVRLPVVPSAVASSWSCTERAEPTGSTLRVLIVDDSVDTAEMLALLLKAGGHDVRTAHEGRAAMESALEYRPDVVLMDIGLPGLNGYEVARRLRQQSDLGNMVLVAMTGYGQERDRQRSQEAGFDHHLVKPPDFSKVQSILATVRPK